jgi:hypothetical protein
MDCMSLKFIFVGWEASNLISCGNIADLLGKIRQGKSVLPVHFWFFCKKKKVYVFLNATNKITSHSGMKNKVQICLKIIFCDMKNMCYVYW